MAFKSKYSSSEVEGLLDKVNGMGDNEITKEQVENVLTGNISTHRHDATYVMNDYDTDVWDGTSISTSLQGSGTKDNPYLIQSCADWLHLFVNGLGSYNTQKEVVAPTEFSPVFKLNKNLDFGNKTIPDMNIGSNLEDIMGVFCEFDGCGARISNFVSPVMENILTMSIGVFPFLYASFVHDFVIDNAQLDVTLTSDGGDLSIFSLPSYGVYVISLNNIIRVKANISGSIGENEIKMVMSYLSTMNALEMAPSLKTFIDNYLEENGYFLGVDIEVTDSTVKESNGKLFVYNRITNDTPITIFSSTPMTEIEIGNEEPVFEGDYAISIIVGGQQPAAFYANSDGASKIYFETYGVISTFTGTPKSITEMQSAAFVEELNSHIPKPAFKQDPDGGTPVLIQGNPEIDYDGYVKQSIFDTTVDEINSSIAGNKTVVFSDVNFFQEKTTGSQQQKFFVEDNFIEELGGLEKARELFELIIDQNKIIRAMMFAYAVPYIYDVTSKILFNQTKGDTVVPEDGDSFYIQIGAFVAMGTSSTNTIPYSFSTTVTVENFNKENMTVKIDRAIKGLVSSDGITNMLEKTQTEYDSLETKDSQTLYLITE